jgi:hypothetical protein
VNTTSDTDQCRRVQIERKDASLGKTVGQKVLGTNKNKEMREKTQVRTDDAKEVRMRRRCGVGMEAAFGDRVLRRPSCRVNIISVVKRIKAISTHHQ